MSLQDWLALGALAAGLLALPAARTAWRSARRTDRQDEFRAQLASLRSNQAEFARHALNRSPEHWKYPGFPMLVRPGWIPDAPFDLDEIQLTWRGTSHETSAPSWRSASRVVSELRLGDITNYSTALTRVASMNSLFDGKIYRLIEADLQSDSKQMTFTESSYFAYLDSSEVLAFETARVASRRWPSGRKTHRRYLADPFDFRNRVVGLGIDTLTIRSCGDKAGFFLHRRDPTWVVNNAAQIGVIPAGEFTPSDLSSEATENDFDLWKNIMREYAEEFLGVADAQGQGGRWLDYAKETPYRQLADAKASGKLKIKVLGLGLDPLPWKPELLTVCVIDAQPFDVIFGRMVRHNNEGLILTGGGKEGLPFDAVTVERYCQDDDISLNAKACLQLAWRFRADLGLSGLKFK